MDNIKNAMKGQGGGLQGVSSAIGNSLAENTQSPGQKKADAANTSLNEYSDGKKGSGATVGGTSIKAEDQIANQSSGAADHLNLGFRK